MCAYYQGLKDGNKPNDKPFSKLPMKRLYSGVLLSHIKNVREVMRNLLYRRRCYRYGRPEASNRRHRHWLTSLLCNVRDVHWVPLRAMRLYSAGAGTSLIGIYVFVFSMSRFRLKEQLSFAQSTPRKDVALDHFSRALLTLHLQ